MRPEKELRAEGRVIMRAKRNYEPLTGGKAS
jgi:hypothetical protein